MNAIEYWQKLTENPAARPLLTGRKIVDVRYQSDSEVDTYGWICRALVLVLDNGAELVLSTDSEGNGPGAMFYFEGGKREVFSSMPRVEINA
tara:strand:- start:151 stop:426 length:276 start_codon:yes stop_codon:yes gene_type:complete